MHSVHNAGELARAQATCHQLLMNESPPATGHRREKTLKSVIETPAKLGSQSSGWLDGDSFEKAWKMMCTRMLLACQAHFQQKNKEARQLDKQAGRLAG